MTNRRLPIVLVVSIISTVLALALPFVGDRDGTFVLRGREVSVRVLLVGALLLAVAALTRRSSERRQARQLVTAAVVLLGFTAALVIRFVTPTGAILLSIAIGSLLWQRRVLASA